jgi:HEPN domain-containing protein
MAKNYEVWLAQSADDYETARFLIAGEKHNWACYLAAQSAEKALKAMLLFLGEQPGFTHSLNSLLNKLAGSGFTDVATDRLKLGARFLTRIELQTRYPVAENAPKDLYGQEESVEAVQYAKGFLELAVTEILSRPLNEYLAEFAQSKTQRNDD